MCPWSPDHEFVIVLDTGRRRVLGRSRDYGSAVFRNDPKQRTTGEVGRVLTKSV